MYNKVIIGLLAAQSISAVALNDKDVGDLSHAGTEWQLKQLNKKVGNLKWNRPHEAEVFDLSNILTDFYDQISMKYGSEDYGTFQHHGAYYKYGVQPLEGHDFNYALHDSDFGLKEHGTPENVHNHFNYQLGTSTKSFWNPFPLPRAQQQAMAVHYDGHDDHHGYHYVADEAHAPELPARKPFQWSVPEVHYPAPKPYSYEVTNPSLLYREVEHIAPPKYESPGVPDLAKIETFPEGYTNEYDNYYIENYFGSDGSDHAHFLYDNIDKIDLDHGHWNPDPHAKNRPVQPAWDHYFVPVVNGNAHEANYESLDNERNAEAKKLQYYDPEFGVYRYLYDNSLVPGQSYQAQHGSHHDEYIPGAYVEHPDGSVQLYEDEVIPTEVIYENPVIGEPTVTAVPATYDSAGYPQQSADYPEYLNDALSMDFLDDYYY
jgi:hypothetical protein